MKKTEIPFYLSTWFIALMCTLWPFFGIPLVAGIVLIVIRHTKYKIVDKDTYATYGDLEDANAILARKASEIEEQTDRIDVLLNEQKSLKARLKDLKNEIGDLQKEAVFEYSQLKFDDDTTSSELKTEFKMQELKEKELLKSNAALIIEKDLSKKELQAQSKQILRSFNSEISILMDKLTANNADSIREKLAKSFETLNKIYAIDGIALSKELLKLKFDQFDMLCAIKIKEQQEKEQQQAIKEQMKEEERVRREIEAEKKKIEKEEKQFSAEVKKLMDYMSKTTSEVEKQLYVDKIKELEEKLRILQDDKERVLEREANTRAGFVYIISNIGSFGEDVFKVGMTRRLEPMDRVKELSSASVPFEFDVHAMIFSEDAPGLENMLHSELRDYQVNKVNPRKEFFKVDLNHIAGLVKERFNATTEFTMIAEAQQYRESLKLEQLNAPALG